MPDQMPRIKRIVCVVVVTMGRIMTMRVMFMHIMGNGVMRGSIVIVGHRIYKDPIDSWRRMRPTAREDSTMSVIR
ncbi:hypothetical protein Pla8534_64050 [Lignipirellula cremea]|uniref:Uncharacterized protein n=1 Tax=Lignipirellula cremea TaxID=2528010 RepID=A0A518E371_9BACT|nr:hypothetical protein Pla8534_64050 [Lignipirellula cremea]